MKKFASLTAVVYTAVTLAAMPTAVLTVNAAEDGTAQKAVEIAQGYLKSPSSYKNTSGAWCVKFALDCVREAGGIPRGVSNDQASTNGAIWEFFNTDNSSYHSWVDYDWYYNGYTNPETKIENYTPRIGDVVFFENNGDSSDGPDHTGLVVGVSGTGRNAVVTTIEGNISSTVVTATYKNGGKSVSDSVGPNQSIVGFATPIYTKSSDSSSNKNEIEYKNPLGTRERVVETAISHVGDTYINAYDDDYTGPWTAHFVNYCLSKSEIAKLESRNDYSCYSNSVTDMMLAYYSLGRYHSKKETAWSYGDKSMPIVSKDNYYTPKIGDIVFIEDDKNYSNGPDKVGIVYDVEGSDIDAKVYTIEGNYSTDKTDNWETSVVVEEWRKDTVWGYATPNYPGTTSSAPSGSTSLPGTRNRVIEIALSHIGDNYINAYEDNYASDWCAHFANYCIKKAIVPTLISESGYACDSNSTTDMMIAYNSLGRYHSRIESAWSYNNKSMPVIPKENNYTPKPGDIVLIETNKDYSDGPDHVGLVYDVVGTGIDTKIYTIEGNAKGDQNSDKYYYETSKVVIDWRKESIWGYCSPSYSNSDNGTYGLINKWGEDQTKPVYVNLSNIASGSTTTTKPVTTTTTTTTTTTKPVTTTTTTTTKPVTTTTVITTTKPDGYSNVITLPNIPEGTKILIYCVAGDSDNNNTVNALDASNILREYALMSTGNTSTFTSEQQVLCDVDGNGKIDAGDASMILAYYAFIATGGDEPICIYYNVKSKIKGDVTGDGFIELTDLATLKQYLSKDECYIDEENADLNSDGQVDLTDLTMLSLKLLEANIKGDVNGDGEINISDLEIMKEYVDTNGTSHIIANNADFDENGLVDETDYLLLKQLLLK